MKIYLSSFYYFRKCCLGFFSILGLCWSIDAAMAPDGAELQVLAQIDDATIATLKVDLKRANIHLNEIIGQVQALEGDQDHRPLHKFIFFGATGVGKSSCINYCAGIRLIFDLNTDGGGIYRMRIAAGEARERLKIGMGASSYYRFW